MRKALALALLGVVVAATAGSAQIIDTKTINYQGPGSINQTYFTVTTAGTFHIFTTSQHDSYLYLYQAGNSTAIGVNDDGNCATGGDNFCDASITLGLGLGDYLAASGHIFFTQQEGFDGERNQCGGNYHACQDGTFTITNTIEGLNGAEAEETNATPEPASFILIGTGLAGVAFMRRRRNAA